MRSPRGNFRCWSALKSDIVPQRRRMIQLGYFTVDTPDIDKARAFFSALFGWTFDEEASGPT